MSYLSPRPALGAVSGTSLGLGVIIAGAVAVIVLWPRGGGTAAGQRRKGWLSQNSKHRRACELSRKRAPKKPMSPITC